MTHTARVCLFVAVGLASVLQADQMAQTQGIQGLTQDQLFQRTRVWDAHLLFTPEQWKAIEPTRIPPTGVGRDGEWLQGREGSRNGWRTAQFGIEFNYVHADLEFAGSRFRDVAVRFKGSATYSPRSTQANKNSFKIDLNKYVKGQKLAGVSTLNFHNAIADPGFLNEVLAYRVYRDAGVPASRTAYVRVSLTVPGQFDRRYLGLYVLVENVDSNFIQARFGSSDGAVLKPVSVNLFSDLGSDWAKYNQTYDPKTVLTDAEKARIIEFCKFVTHATDAAFAKRIGEFVDLDAFATYFAVLVWMNNWDTMLERGQNFYAYLAPTTRRLMFIPWDQDAAFGQFPPQRQILTTSLERPWQGNMRFLERMLAVPGIRAAYLARMRELVKTVFEPGRFVAQVGELATTLRPLVAKEPPKMLPTPHGLLVGDQIAVFNWIASGETGLLTFPPKQTENISRLLAQ
jgi:spore coat protein H